MAFLKSAKFEKGFTWLSIASFAGYVSYGYFSPQIPSSALADALVFTGLLGIILAQFLFTLVKLSLWHPAQSQKWLFLGAVAITGHFGAWLYCLFFSGKYLNYGQKSRERPKAKGKVVHAQVIQEIPESEKSLNL